MPLLAAFFTDTDGVPQTGLSAVMRIVNEADGIVQAGAAMTELTNLTGVYIYDFDTAAGWTDTLRWVGRADGGAGLGALRYAPITEVTAHNEDGDSVRLDVTGLQDNTITAAKIAAAAITASEAPNLDVAVSTRATQAQILSDATPFAGADIAAILADTAAMQPLIDVATSTRSSHTPANVDTQLSGTHGAGSWATATGFAVPGDAMALTAAAVLSLVDDIWDEDIVAAHGTADTSGLLLRALGALISQRANNSNLNALLGVPDSLGIDIIDRIATWLETAGPNPHGTGAWDATATVPLQDIRDAMKLAPTAGAPAAGSVDEHLDDILADTASLDNVKITTARANNLDEITAVRLAELDAANVPADAAAAAAASAAAAADTTTIIATGGPGPWTTGAGASPAVVAAAVWSEILPALFPPSSAGAILGAGGAGPWTTATGFAVPGSAMTLTPAERTAVATAVRDLSLVGSPSGSLGAAIQVVLGVSGKANAVWDNFVYNATTQFLTSCRMRIFATSGAATSATPGAADGADSEIFRVNLTANPDGTFPGLPADILGVLT